VVAGALVVVVVMGRLLEAASAVVEGAVLGPGFVVGPVEVQPARIRMAAANAMAVAAGNAAPL
jgi:hypothetical protein